MTQSHPLINPLSVLGASHGEGTGPLHESKTLVDCAVYVDGVRRPGKLSPAEALAYVRARPAEEDGTAASSRFVWVGLFEPDEAQMRTVGEVFGLHELTIEDAVHAHQRPKLELYDDILVLVLKTVKYIPHESIASAKQIVESGEILMFVGKDFIVTVRHGGHGELTGVRKTLEKNPEKLCTGPLTVVHAIVDHIVDAYLSVTDAVELDVDTMEESIFTPRVSNDIELIYLLKREVVELRRAITPLGPALARLAHPDPALASIIPKEARRYFRDVQDHHTVVSERVNSYDEVLSSLVQAALGKVGMQQNSDMRKITAWAGILAVPTMIAGIYGMNFDNMPELKWHYGYFMALGLMLSICTVLFVGFRRSKWL